LVDPDAYEGPLLGEPEVVVDEANPDWDEEKLRRGTAAEVEEIIAETQPGVPLEGQAGEDSGAVQAVDAEAEAASEQESVVAAEGAQEGPVPQVVLKIRRLEVQPHAAKGEMVVTRACFALGDSEYLLNGKIVQAGGYSGHLYGRGLGRSRTGIIGQERIGQLLSSPAARSAGDYRRCCGDTRQDEKRLADCAWSRKADSGAGERHYSKK